MMNGRVSERLRKELAKDHTAYVLITCSEPNKAGSMNVEMNYDGDPVLAAYLLQSAQSYLDDVDLEDGDWNPLVGDEFRHVN
jgi:hypothetical protein